MLCCYLLSPAEGCRSRSCFFRYSSFSRSASSSMDVLIQAFSSSMPSPVYVDIGMTSLNSRVLAGIISSSSRCKKSEKNSHTEESAQAVSAGALQSPANPDSPGKEAPGVTAVTVTAAGRRDLIHNSSQKQLQSQKRSTNTALAAGSGSQGRFCAPPEMSTKKYQAVEGGGWI